MNATEVGYRPVGQDDLAIGMIPCEINVNGEWKPAKCYAVRIVGSLPYDCWLDGAKVSSATCRVPKDFKPSYTHCDLSKARDIINCMVDRQLITPKQIDNETLGFEFVEGAEAHVLEILDEVFL